jgi:hypothetical protein
MHRPDVDDDIAARLVTAHAFYIAHYGVIRLQEMRDAYERRGFHTLAELAALKHAGLTPLHADDRSETPDPLFEPSPDPDWMNP